MTIGRSIMDMFRTAPPQQQQQQPAPVVTDPSQTNPTVPGTSTVTSDGSVIAIPKAGEGDKSPLEGFKDLWNTPTDPKAKKPARAEDLVPNMTVDPAKLLAAAQKIDFTKSLDAALVEKASKGDAAALSQVINQAAQAGFAQSANATANLITEALKRQANVFKTEVMPEILRRHSVSSSLAEENPIFQNPAIKPMIDMVESQLLLKNPTASPAEITKMAKEYVAAMSGEVLKANGVTLTPKTESQKGSGTTVTRGQTNWEDWFGVTPAT